MAYQLDWHEFGVVKQFSGRVTFRDVYTSEREIIEDWRFSHLRYVLSDYLNILEISLTSAEQNILVALRLGARHTNSRLKYAYLSSHPCVQEAVADSIKKSRGRFEQCLFQTYLEAMHWVAG